jgi:hypothetical protein
MAGRQVEPVYVLDGTYDLMTTNMQADCAAFTEDDEVFAAFSSAVSTAVVGQLADCLVEHETMFVWNSRAMFDHEDFDRWAPYVYMPNYLSGDRYGFILDELDRIGYFEPDARVGLIAMDEPGAQRLLTNIVEPGLDELGVNVVDVASTPTINSIAEVGNIIEASRNLVLRFKDAGVTHVMFVGTYSSASYYFPIEAKNQDYFPRFAFNSSEATQGLNADLPPEALSNSVGIGWIPGLDVFTAQDPGGNPAVTTCLEDIVGAAGLTPHGRTAEYLALNICDGLLFMKAAFDAAETLSPDDIATAVADLDFQSGVTFESSLSDGQVDGAAGFRAYAFDDSCRCFTYTDTETHPIPGP